MPNLTPSPRFQVVRALTGLAVLLVALTVHVTNAYPPHHGHDHDSKAHKASRLWDPTTRGSLVALDLDHTKFTVLYYDMKTESVKSWSTPVCVIDRGARDQQSGSTEHTFARFSLCPPEVSPWPILDRGPHNIPYDGCVWPDMFEGESGHPINMQDRDGILTFPQEGVGQVYINLLSAYESAFIFPSRKNDASTWPDPRLLAIKLALPVSNHDLIQAGISDILSFYRLAHRPLQSRQLVTATQLFAIYLSLILQHTTELISSSSSSLSATSARISSVIPIVPGTWSAYQSPGPRDISPLSSLLRAMPAFDSRPPTVFRTLSRPLATVQGAQMDQLVACLHRPLRVLVLHRGQRHGLYQTWSALQVHMVDVSLSGHLSVQHLHPHSDRLLDIYLQFWFERWIDWFPTHVVLTGNGWTTRDLSMPAIYAPYAEVWSEATVTMPTDAMGRTHAQHLSAAGAMGWMQAPHLSAAATILAQQYSPGAPDQREVAAFAQCALVTRADRKNRWALWFDMDNEDRPFFGMEPGVLWVDWNITVMMPLIIAATALSTAPVAIWTLPFANPFSDDQLASDTDFYAQHVSTDGWVYLGRMSNNNTVGVHKHGWDFTDTDGGGRCIPIPRAGPSDLQQHKHMSKDQIGVRTPPVWAQVACLNPYLVPGSVARLRENQVEMAVVEWWVVDKRQFAPDLGKDEGGNSKGKCGQ